MKKTYQLIIFIVLSASMLTGCVYYRLLKLKWQMEKFEENFELDDKNGLTLIFKNPILSKEDIKWLMNNEPTKVSDYAETQNNWTYILTKKHKEGLKEEKNYDIYINMNFENNKLKKATLPKRFLENLSKEMLAKIFKSMGKSKVDKKKKHAGSVLKGGKKEGIPTIYDVLHTLGEPYENEDVNEIKRLKYIYNLKKPNGDFLLKPFDLIFDFEINNEDKLIRKSIIDVNGLKMSMNFVVE